MDRIACGLLDLMAVSCGVGGADASQRSTARHRHAFIRRRGCMVVLSVGSLRKLVCLPIRLATLGGDRLDNNGIGDGATGHHNDPSPTR
jgi:hypothetical protein